MYIIPFHPYSLQIQDFIKLRVMLSEIFRKMISRMQK